jgi:hypothetical protein
MWPSLPTANHIADLANVFFIGSLVAGVVSTILIVWMSGVKETYWEKDRTESAERVAGLVLQGDQLRKDTAEANARTKESELALAELSSPRNIDPAPFKKALEGVTPVKVEILYAEACSDCFWLASWISNFLGPQGGLGWPIVGPRPLMPVTSGDLAGLPPAMPAHAATWGVTVVASKKLGAWDDGTPPRALLMALVRSMGKRPLVSGNVDDASPKDAVRIVVAPKT